MNLIKFINQLKNNGIVGENQITISISDHSNTIYLTLLKAHSFSLIELLSNSFNGLSLFNENDDIHIIISKSEEVWQVLELSEHDDNMVEIETKEIATPEQLFQYLFKNFRTIQYKYQDWIKYVQLPDFEDIYQSLISDLNTTVWKLKEQYIDNCEGNFEKNITVFEKNGNDLHVYPPQGIHGLENREVFNHHRENEDSPYNWEDIVELYFKGKSLSDLF